MIFVIIAILVLLTVAALGKGASDRLQFKFGEGWTKGLNPEFWDPEKSWRNKWKKDAEGELIRPLTNKFWLSSTALVALTDGWHLMQSIQYNAIRAAVAIGAGFALGLTWYWWVAIFAGLWILQAAAFHVTYTVLLHPAQTGYGVVAAAQPIDLIGLFKIISFIPDVLKMIFGPERKARRAVRQRNKYAADLHQWRNEGSFGWTTYAMALRDYDATGREWDKPDSIAEYYAANPVVLAQSIPAPIDVRGKLAKDPRHNYSKTSLTNKQIYIPHMSGEDNATAENMARFHVAPVGVAPNGKPTGKGWPGIGYQRVTDPSGQRYICHDYETVSYHCGGSNEKSIGNCLIGDFNVHPPTPEQLDALVKDIIDYNEVRTKDPQLSRCSVSWHDVQRPGWTTCPGKFFPKQEVLDRVAAYYAPAPKPVKPTPKPTVPTMPEKTPSIPLNGSGSIGCMPSFLTPKLPAHLMAAPELNYDIVLPQYEYEPVAMAAGQVADWGYLFLGAKRAHEFTRGEGAVVFILDTAGTFAAHPDLAANNLTEYNQNFSNSASSADVHGHGTHCAGIVASIDNEEGVVGIAPGAALVACKVLNDSGGGSYPWISQAIRYVADLPETGRLKDKARIISLSLGGPAGVPTPDHLKVAIDYAIGRGCFIVAAAGNNGYTSGGRSTVGAPGNYQPVITVASVDSPGTTRSTFSSGGREVDLAAPGGSIYSTHLNGGYAKLNGTSMAGPQVVGVIALLLSLRQDIQTQTELCDFLEAHATDILTPGRDDESGYGVPVLDKIIERPAPAPAPVDPGLSDWEPIKAYGRRDAAGVVIEVRYLPYGQTPDA